MKRNIQWSKLALSIFLISCGSSDGDQPVDLNPSKKMSPAGRQSMDRQAEDAMRLREMNQVEEENKLSPYRYVISTERYSIFGKLLNQSTHSKTVHSRGVTLLAPTDKAFEAFDNWKMMLGKGNQDMLDDFIAHHVVTPILSYESFKSADSHETIAGDSFDVIREGGIYFNGAHVRSGSIATENGIVIGMDDVVYIPMALR